jgi:PhnB protein
MPAKPIPEGYSVVSPYLVVPDAATFIDFMTQALGATEVRRFANADGGIMHAEVRIGDSVIMLGDAAGGSRSWTAMLHVYVADCDASYKRAVDAGCTPVREPSDNPDGDRRGGVDDKWGNQWWFATHVKDA